MTKIPILLSAISLLGGVSPLSDGIITQSTDLSLKANESSVVANQNVAGLNFTKLNLATGQLDWDFQYQDDEGRVFSRYVMASLNFMGGITEAEADRNLATLGESDNWAWVNWLTSYDARDGRYTKGESLGATLAWGDMFKNNQSDLVYYAIQYKNWDDPTVEPVWYRGKLDYRSCAHTPNIESTYQSMCQISLDPITNQYVFTPSDGTLSYEDEMAQILRELYLDAVRGLIEGLIG